MKFVRKDLLICFYLQKCDLVRHLKVHAGYKPFSCTICLMTFNAKHQLKNHVRMHTGEKPFTCEVSVR